MLTTDQLDELADWIITTAASGGAEFVIADDGDDVSRQMVDEIQARRKADESLAGLVVDAPGGAFEVETTDERQKQQ